MTALRRTRAGNFTIETAHTLDAVLAGQGDRFTVSSRETVNLSPCPAKSLTDTVIDFLLPTDSIFSELPSITLNETDTRKAKNGALLYTKIKEDGKYRVYAPDGEFLLLGEIKNNQIKTIKSFYEVS